MLEAKDLEMIAETVKKAVEPVRKDVAGLQEEMSEMRKDITGLQEGMSEMRKDITGMQEGMSEMREDITGLQQKVTELQKTSDETRKDVADIRITMENEVLRGIRIIGEGHLDLSRKMNQILETKEERELMELRVLSLEHEVRRIKDRLEIA